MIDAPQRTRSPRGRSNAGQDVEAPPPVFRVRGGGASVFLRAYAGRMPLKPCIEHRCPNYSDGKDPRCEEHRLAFQRARKGWTTGHRGTSAAWSRIRRKALARDRYRCQKCGRTRDQEKAITGKDLHVHHKDGESTNDALENLETLCADCHGIENVKALRKVSALRQHAQKSHPQHFGQVPLDAGRADLHTSHLTDRPTLSKGGPHNGTP